MRLVEMQRLPCLNQCWATQQHRFFCAVVCLFAAVSGCGEKVANPKPTARILKFQTVVDSETDQSYIRCDVVGGFIDVLGCDSKTSVLDPRFRDGTWVIVMVGNYSLLSISTAEDVIRYVSRLPSKVRVAVLPSDDLDQMERAYAGYDGRGPWPVLIMREGKVVADSNQEPDLPGDYRQRIMTLLSRHLEGDANGSSSK